MADVVLCSPRMNKIWPRQVRGAFGKEILEQPIGVSHESTEASAGEGGIEYDVEKVNDKRQKT